MSEIRKLIREKFGYTTNLPSVNAMHKDVTDRNGRDGKNPAYLPIEQYRNVVKALLGATTTEEDGKIENTIDFQALHRLANKHAFAPAFLESLNTIQVHIEKGKDADRDIIMQEWKKIKDNVPYWFIGLLSNKDKTELPEEDKKLLTNLKEMMEEFNKNSEKIGKEKAKNTEHASRDTQAKKNLDVARKDAKMDTDAASEKKLKEKPENKVG